MKLDVIYQESKGVLSRAERDFYLGYCSFADNETGLCYPKMKTVAERVGIPVQSASRMYKSIIGYGFLERSENGHRCLIGYTKSKRDVNFIPPKPVEKSSPDVNLSSPVVNSSSPDVNLHIKEGTTHLTIQSTKKNRRQKPDDSPELQAFRTTLTAYQKSYAPLPTQGLVISNLTAIRKLFPLAGGDAEKCIRYHEELQAEHYRKGRVDWNTVLKNFHYFGKETNGSNQKHNTATKPTNEDRLAETFTVISQYPTEAELRGIP